MRKPDAPSPPVTAALLLEQPNIAGDSYGNGSGGVRDVALAAWIRFEYGSGSRYRDTRARKKAQAVNLVQTASMRWYLGRNEVN